MLVSSRSFYYTRNLRRLKEGSPTPATSSGAAPGTMKHYDLYEDSFGDLIEVHYFRHPDGSVGDVKIKE
jgi:hypothetical protein